MDPSDPLHLRLIIDHSAIRSGQLRWLTSFVSSCGELMRSEGSLEELSGKGSTGRVGREGEASSPGAEAGETAEGSKPDIYYLPNLSYSCALAQFLLESSDSSSSSSSSSTSTSTNNASSDHVCTDSSRILLCQALLNFSSLLTLLAPTIASAELDSLLLHPHFAASPPGNSTYSKICTIYTKLSADFWRSPEVLPWLLEVVKDVCVKVDNGDTAAKKARAKFEDHFGERSQLFSNRVNPDISVNEYTGHIDQIPAEAMQEAQQWGGGGNAGMMMGPGGMYVPEGAATQQSVPPPAVRNSPLLMFLWSMAPWNDFSWVPDENAFQDEGDGE